MKLTVAEQAFAAPAFRAKIDGMYAVHPDSGCWEWTGPLSKYGYGYVAVAIDRRNRMTGAHRASWIVHRGPIPDGLFLDHLCRNPKCVNPNHLEPVTPGENTRRGVRDGGFTITPELNRRRNAWRPPLHERGCRTHGQTDLQWRYEKHGYLYWTCRICTRERAREYRQARRDRKRDATVVGEQLLLY